MDEQARLDLALWQHAGEKLRAANPEMFAELLVRFSVLAERESLVAAHGDLPLARTSFFVSA